MLYYYFVDVVHYHSVYTFVPIHSYIHTFIFTFIPSQNERTNQSKTLHTQRATTITTIRLPKNQLLLNTIDYSYTKHVLYY